LIEKAQDLMDDCDLKSDLIYIYSNFGTLNNSITQLETFWLSLHHLTKIVHDVENKIQQAENRAEHDIYQCFPTGVPRHVGVP